jgi:hypothetical protein
LVPLTYAGANSAPSTTLLIEFDEDAQAPKTLKGLQLISCDTAECRQRTLLVEYGECDAPECLIGPPSLYRAGEPECLDNKCVLYMYLSEDIPLVRILAQYTDGVRESNAAPGGLPYWATKSWQVSVRETRLDIHASADWDPWLARDSFFAHLALTVVTEILVASVILWAWLRFRGRRLTFGAAYVLLANLISFPLTWFLWPSLTQFQPAGSRVMGYYIAVATALVTAFIADLSLTNGGRWRKIALGLVVVVSVVCSSLGVVLFTYGQVWIAVQGMSLSMGIAVAEVFAVALETLLVYLLARKGLALRWSQTALICLLTNAVSYLLGRLL